MSKVTGKMIGVAYDIMLARGDFILSAEMLKKIYLAMDQAKPRDAEISTADENERLRNVLHAIVEEWAGAECGEPVYAQEAYAIALARRMYTLSADGLGFQAIAKSEERQ